MKTTRIRAAAIATPALVQAACEPGASFPLESFRTTEHAADHHLVYTDILIDAPAGAVRSARPGWSPALQGIIGEVANGSAATVLYKVADQVAEILHVISVKGHESFG